MQMLTEQDERLKEHDDQSKALHDKHAEHAQNLEEVHAKAKDLHASALEEAEKPTMAKSTSERLLDKDGNNRGDDVAAARSAGQAPPLGGQDGGETDGEAKNAREEAERARAELAALQERIASHGTEKQSLEETVAQHKQDLKALTDLLEVCVVDS